MGKLQKNIEIEKSIFDILVNRKTTFDGFPILWSSSMLANKIGKTKYAVLQGLRKLKKKGLIVYTYWHPTCMCGYEEPCCCSPLPIRGRVIKK